MKWRLESVTKDSYSLDLVAAGMAVVVFFSWAFLLFKKYYSFGYCDWDLAFFSQGMYGLLKGNAYSSLFETNLLGNHSNLIAYLIVPIFALIPHPLTLVVLKILSYSLAGLILYHMAVPHIGRTYALAILFLYYGYLPNAFGLLHDFDFESLSPVFLMAMIFFFERKHWRAFLVTSFFTILIKENMPLVVAAFGLYGLVFEKDKVRLGLIPFLMGATSFIFLVKFLIPSMAPVSYGGIHPYTYIYEGLWQNGLSGAFVYFGRMVLDQQNVSFYQGIFSVFFFLPLIAFGVLIPAVPLLLQHILSSAETHHSIRFYYVLSIAPFVFYALICVLERFKQILRRASFIFLFILCLGSYFLQWKAYWPIVQMSFRCYCCQQPTENMISRQTNLVSQIPSDAGVIASFGYLTHLAANPQLFPFQRLYVQASKDPARQWLLPPTVKYALINMDDPWFYPYAPVDQNERYLFVLKLLGGVNLWDLVGQAGQTVLLKKKE